MSSVVHHFKSIGEFTLDVQSGNAQLGSKSTIFFVTRDLEIWWMALKHNRSSLLYHVKLCASFQSHQCIQTGVTIRKRPIRVIIGNFLSPVTFKFDGWPWKTIRLLFYTTLNFVHHFRIHQWIQTGVTVWKRPNRVEIGDFFCPLWLWNLVDDLEKQKGTSATLLCCFNLSA